MNDHTRKSIGLGSSPMFDSVEIVRDGKAMKSIPRETIEATPKPEPLPRNPVVILSGIWSLAMVIRGSDDEVISHYAGRIVELCAELEAALLQSQLRGSIKP